MWLQVFATLVCNFSLAASRQCYDDTTAFLLPTKEILWHYVVYSVLLVFCKNIVLYYCQTWTHNFHLTWYTVHVAIISLNWIIENCSVEFLKVQKNWHCFYFILLGRGKIIVEKEHAMRNTCTTNLSGDSIHILFTAKLIWSLYWQFSIGITGTTGFNFAQQLKASRYCLGWELESLESPNHTDLVHMPCSSFI